MRRLPIYFLLDVSESMVGEPIARVQEGMRTVIQELRSDPYALETVFVSLIAFAGTAKTLVPLTELYRFYPPAFPIGGGTGLGRAMAFLMDEMDRSVQKTTAAEKGDWKPIVFLFTDGVPTDSCERAISRWNANYRRHCNLIAVSIGGNADTHLLGNFTENVLVLEKTTAQSFKNFFKWITASIKTSSVSVAESGVDELKLPSGSGFDLKKVPEHAEFRPDENFVVLHGKCSTTKKEFLVKFAKRISALPGVKEIGVTKYRLVGAYPIDGEEYASLSGASGKPARVNTSDLIGAPTCPCCGNAYGVVVCSSCGKIFCADENRVECPWCGLKGRLGKGGDGFDINRAQG